MKPVNYNNFEKHEKYDIFKCNYYFKIYLLIVPTILNFKIF